MNEPVSIGKNNVGAPSQYTEAIGEQVCARLAEGVLVTTIAVDLGFHPTTLLEWREKYPRFGSAYARAEQAGFDRLAERLLHITDTEGDVQKQRLQSDNIKWFLSKRAAKIYGDRLDVNIQQTIDIGSALQEARARALRPVCDQQDIDDAETVAFTEVQGSRAPDTQSDAAPKPPRPRPGGHKKNRPGG